MIFPGRKAGASLKHDGILPVHHDFDAVFPGRSAGAALKDQIAPDAG